MKYAENFLLKCASRVWNLKILLYLIKFSKIFGLFFSEKSQNFLLPSKFIDNFRFFPNILTLPWKWIDNFLHWKLLHIYLCRFLWMGQNAQARPKKSAIEVKIHKKKKSQHNHKNTFSMLVWTRRKTKRSSSRNMR